MKQMRYLVLLLLTLTVSSTAYCQITGLPRETKVAIVSTIETYDAVLIELDLHKQLLAHAEEMIILLREQILVKDKLIENLELQVKSFNREIGLQDKEIKNIKIKSKVLIGGGIALVVLALILK